MGRKNRVLEKVFDNLDIKVNPDSIEPNNEIFIPTYEMTEIIRDNLNNQK